MYLFSITVVSRVPDPAENESANGKKWLTDASLWALLAALEGSFILFFAIFVKSINKKYVTTFYTTMTAREFRIKSYREAKSPQAKIQVLKLHPSYYASIRGEVAGWVQENYISWIEERPSWFTERVKANIPLDMIPADERK